MDEGLKGWLSQNGMPWAINVAVVVVTLVVGKFLIKGLASLARKMMLERYKDNPRVPDIIAATLSVVLWLLVLILLVFHLGFEYPLEAWLAANAVDYAVNIVGVVALLYIGNFLITWIVALARKAMDKVFKNNQLIPNFLASTLSKVLWLLVLMMAATCLGLNVTPLIMGLGVTGFIVGFACQDSLANLAAGIMIAMNEPFTVGDSVTVAGVTGVVHEVSMMATVVRDEAGNRVVVPNKAAWGGVITNRTKKLG